MFKKQKIKPYDRQQVLGILPFELKAKILRHLYAGAIQSVPLLKQMADDDMFLTDMCIRLQPYNCSANTYVYQRGKWHSGVLLLLASAQQDALLVLLCSSLACTLMTVCSVGVAHTWTNMQLLSVPARNRTRQN
jgi:hypothetical protein